MSSVIDSIERDQLRKGLPPFSPGDRVRVHFQVIEGNRKRTQVFEGVVLRRQGSGLRETFTVRKQSFGVGVERTFPLHSPKIEKLEVAARGDVRRAKLYYLRGRVGKAARVAERRWGIDEEMVSAPAATEAVDAEGVGQDEVVPVAEEEPEAGGASEGEADAGDEAAATGAEVSEAQAGAEAGEGSADDGDGAPGPDAAAPETEAAATEAESEAEEPAPEAGGEGGAEAEAAAPEAGETEDQAAPEDAEEEASAKADDSDEDPAA